MSKPSVPKLLVIDIETSPHTAYVWGLFNENIPLARLIEPGQVISFAARWRGEKRVEFRSIFHDGKQAMVERAHQLMDQAQVLIHYNGNSFDRKHLNREFLLAGLNPPSPYLQIDLLRTVRRQFKFASNKLDHVTQQLGLSGKLHNTDFDTWSGCMAGDPKSWAAMKKYNCQDVVTTEDTYNRLLSWIPNHPHIGLLTDEFEDCCNKCGSTDLIREGFAYTDLTKFQQYRCRQCGGWSRGKKAVQRVDARGVAA